MATSRIWGIAWRNSAGKGEEVVHCCERDPARCGGGPLLGGEHHLGLVLRAHLQTTRFLYLDISGQWKVVAAYLKESVTAP